MGCLGRGARLVGRLGPDGEGPRVDVGGDVGELAAGRHDEACILAAEGLADVADEDVVGRVGDGDDGELSVEGIGQGPEETRLLLREEGRRGRIDDLFPEGHELEALLPGEEPSQVDLGDQAALGEDLAKTLTGLDALLERALDRLGGQEAGPEDQRAQRRVGTLTQWSAHGLSIRPRGAAPVARGLKRFHVMSRRGGGIGPV